MPPKHRLVICDDHPLFRDGVANLVGREPDFEVVGQGATVGDAHQLAIKTQPDLILLDFNMPGDIAAALPALKAAAPRARLVILTVSAEETNVLAALRAGAHGYVLKGVAYKELLEILRQVLAGQNYVMPALAATLLTSRTLTPAAPSLSPREAAGLSQRECEILQLVARGLSNKEIGQRLFLTENTVKSYVTDILQKLNVRNRTEAALAAHRILAAHPGA